MSSGGQHRALDVSYGAFRDMGQMGLRMKGEPAQAPGSPARSRGTQEHTDDAGQPARARTLEAGKKSESEVAQSGPTLSDPMDCSPPGSSAHGIFQASLFLHGLESNPGSSLQTPEEA